MNKICVVFFIRNAKNQTRVMNDSDKSVSGKRHAKIM